MTSTEHSVGPAWTRDDFARKAHTTVEDARSAVQTVLFAAQTSADGDAFSSYTDTVLSEQEDLLVGIQGEAVGEGAHGVRVGAAALATLESPDRLGGETGPLGELLLSE